MKYKLQILLFKLIKKSIPLIKLTNLPLPLYLWATLDLKFEEQNLVIDRNEWNKFIYNLNKNKNWGTFRTLINGFQANQKQEIDNYIENLERQYEYKISKLPLGVLQEKVQYLQTQFNLEKQRQSNLDNKTIQVITQSSIVTTIIALIIPLLIDKIDFKTDLYEWLFWVFGLMLLLTLTLLVWSIIIAIKNLRTTGYSRPMHTMILHHSDGNITEMYSSQLTNFYNSTNENIKVNDKKASKINKSYKLFRHGLVLFVLTAFLFVGYRFYKPFEDIKKVKIENAIQEESINKIIHSYENKSEDLNNSIRDITDEMKKQNQYNDSISRSLNEINKKVKYILCPTRCIVHTFRDTHHTQTVGRN